MGAEDELDYEAVEKLEVREGRLVWPPTPHLTPPRPNPPPPHPTLPRPTPTQPNPPHPTPPHPGPPRPRHHWHTRTK